MGRGNWMQATEIEMESKYRSQKEEAFKQLKRELVNNTKEKYEILKRLERFLEGYIDDMILEPEEEEEKKKVLERTRASIKKLEEKHPYLSEEDRGQGD